MVKGLYTAHTGMVNEMKRLDILAKIIWQTQTQQHIKRRNDESYFCR